MTWPWPDGVAVAIPTVPRRAAPLEATLAQWRQFGVDPVVYQQHPSWPLGHASHRRTCDLLLQGILDHHPDATHVLLAEDDVDLHPDLPDVLPMSMSCDVAALMVNGTRFYPQWVKDLLTRGERLPRAVVPIEDQAAWWGTQAVLMTRRVVEQVLAWKSDGAGWDIHLRNWTLHTGTKIHTLIPNPVQHRGVPSLASKRGGGLGRSATYNWPVEEGDR